MAFALGLGLGLTFIAGGVTEGVEWTPALLFAGPEDGLWFKGFAPPPWKPITLFEGADSGFLVDGFKPEAE